MLQDLSLHLGTSYQQMQVSIQSLMVGARGYRPLGWFQQSVS